MFIPKRILTEFLPMTDIFQLTYDAGYYMDLADVYRKEGKPDRAIAALWQAVRLDGGRAAKKQLAALYAEIDEPMHSNIVYYDMLRTGCSISDLGGMVKNLLEMGYDDKVESFLEKAVALVFSPTRVSTGQLPDIGMDFGEEEGSEPEIVDTAGLYNAELLHQMSDLMMRGDFDKAIQVGMTADPDGDQYYEIIRLVGVSAVENGDAELVARVIDTLERSGNRLLTDKFRVLHAVVCNDRKREKEAVRNLAETALSGERADCDEVIDFLIDWNSPFLGATVERMLEVYPYGENFRLLAALTAYMAGKTEAGDEHLRFLQDVFPKCFKLPLLELLRGDPDADEWWETIDGGPALSAYLQRKWDRTVVGKEDSFGEKGIELFRAIVASDDLMLLEHAYESLSDETRRLYRNLWCEALADPFGAEELKKYLAARLFDQGFEGRLFVGFAEELNFCDVAPSRFLKPEGKFYEVFRDGAISLIFDGVQLELKSFDKIVARMAMRKGFQSLAPNVLEAVAEYLYCDEKNLGNNLEEIAAFYHTTPETVERYVALYHAGDLQEQSDRD